MNSTDDKVEEMEAKYRVIRHDLFGVTEKGVRTIRVELVDEDREVPATLIVTQTEAADFPKGVIISLKTEVVEAAPELKKMGVNIELSPPPKKAGVK